MRSQHPKIESRKRSCVGGGIALNELVFVRVCIVGNTTNHKSRHDSHQTSSLHLNANYVEIPGKFVPEDAVLDQRIAGRDSSIVNGWVSVGSWSPRNHLRIVALGAIEFSLRMGISCVV